MTGLPAAGPREGNDKGTRHCVVRPAIFKADIRGRCYESVGKRRGCCRRRDFDDDSGARRTIRRERCSKGPMESRGNGLRPRARFLEATGPAAPSGTNDLPRASRELESAGVSAGALAAITILPQENGAALWPAGSSH